MKVTVVNNLGHDLPEQVASLRGLHEIRIDANARVPADLRGDVIFTHTNGSANLEGDHWLRRNLGPRHGCGYRCLPS